MTTSHNPTLIDGVGSTIYTKEGCCSFWTLCNMSLSIEDIGELYAKKGLNSTKQLAMSLGWH